MAIQDRGIPAYAAIRPNRAPEDAGSSNGCRGSGRKSSVDSAERAAPTPSNAGRRRHDDTGNVFNWVACSLAFQYDREPLLPFMETTEHRIGKFAVDLDVSFPRQSKIFGVSGRKIIAERPCGGSTLTSIVFLRSFEGLMAQNLPQK